MILSGQSVQEIKFEAYDKDLDSDDFLGRCVICSHHLRQIFEILEQQAVSIFNINMEFIYVKSKWRYPEMI